MKNRVKVLGLPFYQGSMQDACQTALSFLPTGGVIYTPNAEMAYRAYRDPVFRQILLQGDLLLPDGQGIVLAAYLYRRKLGRLPGIDMGRELLKSGRRVFFYGGRPGVAEAAQRELHREDGSLLIVGTSHGYLSPAEKAALPERIRTSGADTVFVALGSPLQETWIHENRCRLPGCLLMGIGGALDVYAGLVKRAPLFWQHMGLEWCYRLLQEPKRFLRMTAIPKFLFAAYRDARYTGRSHHCSVDKM